MNKKLLTLCSLYLVMSLLTITAQNFKKSSIPDEIPRFHNENPMTPVFRDHLGQVYYIDSVIENGKWDTLKHLYTYDQNHRLVADQVLQRTGNDWENQQKTVYLYNADGNLLNSETKNWDGNFWQFYKRTVRHYNDLGEYDSSKRQLWQNEHWVNWHLETRTFDDEGRLDVVQHFNAHEGEWVNNISFYYNWDEAGYFEDILIQMWADSCWANYAWDFFTHDMYGNQLSYTRKKWIDSIWKNQFNRAYSYDSLSRLISEIHYSWSDEWINNFRYNFTYDTDGHLTEKVYQKWSTDYWRNHTRYIYTYVDGHQTLFLIQYWDGDAWQDHSKNVYTLDEEGNRTLNLHLIRQDSLWVEDFKTVYNNEYDIAKVTAENFVATENGWEPESSNLQVIVFEQEIFNEILYSVELYYGEYASATAENPETAVKLFCIFPNPAADHINVKINEPDMKRVLIQLVDHDGKIVLERTIDDASEQTFTLNTTEFPAGLYLVRISSAEYRAVQKVIITR